MEIIRWDPSNSMRPLFSDGISPAFSRFGWDFPVDVYEHGKNVVAKAALPGIAADELGITIDDDLLTVTGSREEEAEIDEKDYYSKEIRRGSFSRTVSLPASVDADKADAKYEDGVLTVTAPTIASEKGRGVKVEVKKL